MQKGEANLYENEYEKHYEKYFHGVPGVVPVFKTGPMAVPGIRDVSHYFTADCKYDSGACSRSAHARGSDWLCVGDQRIAFHIYGDFRFVHCS